MNNDFIGGAPATDVPPTAPEVVEDPPAVVEVPAPAVADAPAAEAPIVVETKNYADGSSATGVAPLPDESPAGAPVVEVAEPAIMELVDYKALYDAEVIAHDATKAELKTASELVANAKAMGFRGAGIHTGS